MGRLRQETEDGGPKKPSTAAGTQAGDATDQKEVIPPHSASEGTHNLFSAGGKTPGTPQADKAVAKSKSDKAPTKAASISKR